MRTIKIFGPISWDSVIKIEKYPHNGGFAQAIDRSERPGGTGMNLAGAVSSAGITTELFSYLGDDEIGNLLWDFLQTLGISLSNVAKIHGPSLHAMITIDQDGERTIFALEKNRFNEIDFNSNFTQSDIVVFPVWRTFYKKYLTKASQSRAMTIVGINALDDETVQAKMIVGSEKDVLKTRVDKSRFEYSIFTRGENGVEIYHEDKVLRLPAQKAPVVDTTGAGDSFLSGLLVGLARDLGVETSAQIGVNWASAAIQDLASKPPKWDAQFYA